MPSVYADSALNTHDDDAFGPAMRPGSPAADAPVMLQGQAEWLLRQAGNEFTGIYFAGTGRDAQVFAQAEALARDPIPVQTLVVAPAGQGGPGMFEDSEGLFAARYDARPGTFYLLRPDQHVCARWRYFDAQAVRAAVARATCNPGADATGMERTREVEHA